MIRIPGVEKQKIAVYGLGATGLSACEALIASGADVYCFDESDAARRKTENSKFLASHPKEWPWTELRGLVLSPGVPLTFPKPHVIVRKARQQGVDVFGDIELFGRAMNAFPPEERPRIIAVTGSNGKSTTASLIGHVLKETGRQVHVGGNIGVPLLSLPSPNEDQPAQTSYVLELSSFQLDLAHSFRADTAVFLNISPDHLDRHGDLRRYVAAKKRIFQNQTNGDVAIVGVDDPESRSVCAALNASGAPTVIPVSAGGALGRGVFALNGKMFYRLDEKSGEAGDVSAVASLRGAHNWQNASAALAAAMGEGVAPSVAVRAMERFPGLPHRLETVSRRGKVVFVNDSKATNPEAAATALKAYDDIFWIAGGRLKEGGFGALRSVMPRVRAAYLIGEAAKALETEFAGAVPIFRCADLQSAVVRAARDAETSDIAAPAVVLAPACSSFDQYKNFEERGDAFKASVRALDDAGGEAA